MEKVYASIKTDFQNFRTLKMHHVLEADEDKMKALIEANRRIEKLLRD